ncbi:DNA repair protein RecN [Veillonella sp.]|jgi:DNA repair protein RecN (Recombination protein N)|uniref:DNA repair protein RecN n=1 Tax=Veillonella sp. TaxID=1926307 RepID=UPI0029036CE0|nr:DNA repair protein RecN [Veillonella sp.]MDU2710353.1 DNA repair protein RecN [Veillonella sp.]MDU3432936.1 DNA repair protein RecN [Veillonella sp.]MDU4712052.1 DNA repair protein RecN [Veillonella sp.]MDU5494371.1 DNA repair protein RecN [Veillonella sp.]
MLTQMSIRNFALIEQMNISFNDGITIFTGETGAGKSILMDAFSILLGERASSEFIRHGKDSFVIDGIFDIAHHQSIQELLESKNIMVEEGQLILSRSFNRNGKSSILANDQPIPLKALKEIGQFLADIHGQYSNQRLLDADTHHEYLDTFNQDGKTAYKAYIEAYKVYKQAKQEVDNLQENMSERARELDMLRYQIDEIEDAGLSIGEDISIAEELKRLDSFEHIDKVLGSCYDAFYNGRQPLLDTINSIKVEVNDLVKYDAELKEVSEMVDSAYFQLEEAAQSLDRYRDTISYDEERYKYCQDRDTTIYGLKKKYGDSVEEILAYEEKAQARLEELEGLVFAQDELEARLEEAKKVAEEALTVLHKVRLKNAKVIATALHQELVDLGMPKGDIQFHIEEGDELSSLGAKSIEMLFSANKGEQLLPLHKVASGGELARIALAFKSVFRSDTFKTMVFDEIDVGISGDIALKVAEKILNLSKTNQVFCITHLPQTASIAKQHYHLSKIEQDDRTISTLAVLNEAERVTQIASMMSGRGMSTTALAAAKELIDHFN